MFVKKKDRNISAKESLNRSRTLFQQVLTLTRMKTLKVDGTWTRNGILGYGQAYDVFGKDFIISAKEIHSLCYQGCNIKLDSKETFDRRRKFFNEAIELCDKIMREIDLCLFMYGTTNHKRRSISYVGKLAKDVKNSLVQRKQLDTSILNSITKK